VSCRAEVDGDVKSGFLKKEFLRKPLSKSREALVASVHTEWMRFRRGTGIEHVPPFSGFVGEMWQKVGWTSTAPIATSRGRLQPSRSWC
jgi:hypothetical protein